MPSHSLQHEDIPLDLARKISYTVARLCTNPSNAAAKEAETVICAANAGNALTRTGDCISGGLDDIKLPRSVSPLRTVNGQNQGLRT